MSPVPLPDRPAKRGAALAAAGLIAAVVAPGLAAGPASAAGGCATPLRHAAQASADLVRLHYADLRQLGSDDEGPIGVLRIATSSADMAADRSVAATGTSRMIDARLYSTEAGPLAAAAQQQAPPNRPKPEIVAVTRHNVGAASLSAGRMVAQASWRDGMSCGTATGPAALASSTVAGLLLLPGSEGRALLAGRTLTSETGTGLTGRRGDVRSVAVASAGLADFELLRGTPSPLNIKVVKPPTLTVTTGGTRGTTSVTYDAPVVEIAPPGQPATRLDAPGKVFEVPVPAPVGVPGLPGAPAVPGAAIPLAGAVPRTSETTAPQILVRVSLGQVDQEITADGARAHAVSLRVEFLAPPRSGPAAGALVDVALGVLEASARAPGRGGYGSGSGQGSGGYGSGVGSGSVTPPPTPSPATGLGPSGVGAGGAAPTGRLPVTGSQIGLFLAGGALLVVAGRLLMLLAHRGHILS